jgi:hypothetical protein
MALWLFGKMPWCSEPVQIEELKNICAYAVIIEVQDTTFLQLIKSLRNFYKQLVCGISYQIGEFIFNSNNFLFTTTSIKIVFQQQKPIENNLISLKINPGVVD